MIGVMARKLLARGGGTAFSGEVQIADRGAWIASDRLRLLVEMDAKEIEKLEKLMNRGWCIGSRGFKKDLARDYFRACPNSRRIVDRGCGGHFRPVGGGDF